MQATPRGAARGRRALRGADHRPSGATTLLATLRPLSEVSYPGSLGAPAASRDRRSRVGVLACCKPEIP